MAMAQTTPAHEDPRKRLLKSIESWAGQFMRRMLTEDQVREAAGRLATAIQVMAQQNPAILQCTPESIAQCVAMCALTGLMPGGISPRVYLIPRKQRRKGADGRWGEVHTLTWQIGYHGYEELVGREGWSVQTVMVSHSDMLRPLGPDDEVVSVGGRDVVRSGGALVTLVTGEQFVLQRDIDNPPLEWTEIRGVLVRCTSTNGLVVYGWEPIARVEPRLRVSETFKQAVTKLAKIADGLSLDDWKTKPSEETLAKIAAKPAHEILAHVEGPWSTWTSEMVSKTALRSQLSHGLVPLPDAMRWALEADKRGDVGLPPEPDEAERRAASEPPRAALASPQTAPETIDVPMSSGMDGLAQIVGAGDEEPEQQREASAA